MEKEKTTNQRLKELMDEMRLSQADVAAATGISKSSINQIIHGTRACGLKTAKEIKRAYPRVNLLWLLEGEGNVFVDEPATIKHEGKSYGISVSESDIDDINVSYGGSSYKDSIHINNNTSNKDIESIEKRCLVVLEQANKMLDTINGLTNSLVTTAQQQQEQYKRIDEIYQRLTDAHDGHVARSHKFIQDSVLELKELRKSFHDELEKLSQQGIENTQSIKRECATFRPTRHELETMLHSMGEA